MNPALQISPELISCIVCCIQIPLKRVVEIIFGMFSWFEQHCWHCCHAAPVALTKPEIRIPNSPRTHRARQFPINVTTIPDWIPDRGLSESPYSPWTQWHDPIESEGIKYTSAQFFVVVLILFVSVHEHSDVPCMFFRGTKFQVSVITTKKNLDAAFIMGSRLIRISLDC